MTKLTKKNLSKFLIDLEKMERDHYDPDEGEPEYSEGYSNVIMNLRREYGIPEPDPETLKPPVTLGEVGIWEHYKGTTNPLDNDMYFELKVHPHLRGKVGSFCGAGWWAQSFYHLKEEIANMIKRQEITADRIEIQQIGTAPDGHPYGIISITNG